MRPYLRIAAVCVMTSALVLAGCSGDDAPVQRSETSASETSASQTDPPYLAVPEPPGELVDVGGHRLHLYCTGEGERTVLMDAGLGDFSLIMRPLQDELAATVRVCTYDRAGYGWSEPGPAPRTGERIVAELEALLEAAEEPGPFVLAGHSFGGLTMLMFAEAHPEQVAGVVLIDSSHPRQDEAFAAVPEFVTAQKDHMTDIEGIAARVEAGQVRAVEMLRLAPRSLPLDLKYQWAALYARPPSLGTTVAENDAWAETTGQVGGEGSLGDIPLIVIRAGLPIAEAEPGLTLTPKDAEQVDSIWRSLQENHLTRSTNARIVVAENSGHYVYVDEPALVLDAIRDLTTTE
jgi:pimeloyl-ACP methyl ester carboxylesterase